jgi:hypothetical protein
MKLLIKIICVLALFGTSSCNEYKLFEEEMYKKVFALVSSGDYNILAVEHDLEQAEVTGYVSVSCGGVNSIETDLRITLREDLELFNRYNRSNFDNAEEYARLVYPGMYTIPGYELVIPKGEKLGLLPVKVRPEGLSPDSTYFISFKVDKFSAYEVNADKSDVLYRVILKNYWATQASATNYSLRGIYQGTNLIGNKRVFPLSHNQVRVNVGNTVNFTADTADINTRSVILEVEKAQGEKIAKDVHYNVTVKPYKRITILSPETVDPEYGNHFFIEDDGFRTYKTFRVHYCYKLEGDNTVYEMKEELRLEFVYQDK